LRRPGSRLLPKAARTILDAEQLNHLWKGVDIAGDIAIIKIAQELEKSKHELARSMLALVPYLKVVLRQIGPVESQFRTRKLEWLAGEKRTDTLHREYGCQYKVDLSTTYFSPRLGSERKRIAEQVSPGECVVNFFAGVGSFSIMIAKHARPSRVYSLDLNPAATHYHALNNAINRVTDTIDVICGEAAAVVRSSLEGRADRVLLPLPELALDSLGTAKCALRNGQGFVHCYLFVDAARSIEAGVRALQDLHPVLARMGIAYKNAYAHVVRSVGPCRYQVCVDMGL
jgi:tRNA (guanine37-N1)-methyltransferase